MDKQLLLILLVIAVLLSLIYWFIGSSPVYQEPLPVFKELHLYNNPEQSIKDIEVLVFYFVPSNKIELIYEDWFASIDNSLKKLQDFHSLQLQSRSNLVYWIYQEPVIGLQDSQFYDTDNTQYGNPNALKSIAIELEQRVLKPEGDLYNQSIAELDDSTYLSFIIIYEGVGALGGDNTALISRSFLSDSEYEYVGASIMAHEFYHTLAVPEGYEIPSAVNFTSDIMGLGRLRPIEKTYLRPETLNAFGL